MNSLSAPPPSFANTPPDLRDLRGIVDAKASRQDIGKNRKRPAPRQRHNSRETRERDEQEKEVKAPVPQESFKVPSHIGNPEQAEA